jgi:predicted class III extradiol MEMO1 family dioxygenase
VSAQVGKGAAKGWPATSAVPARLIAFLNKSNRSNSFLVSCDMTHDASHVRNSKQRSYTMSMIKRIISRRDSVRPVQVAQAHPNFWMYQ